MQDVKSAIKDKVENIANKYDQELVDIELDSIGGNKVIRLIIGSKQGPTINDLTRITKEFNQFVEAENPIDFDYSLEVSSPGLDRPLKSIADFRRNVGRSVKITFFNSQEDKNVHDKGSIEDVDFDKEIVSFNLCNSGVIDLELETVVKAKLIVELKKKKNKKNKYK